MESNNISGSSELSTSESLNLRHYWHVMLEHRWLVITAFISVFILSIIYLVKATPIYQASAVLQINRESNNVMDIGSPIVFSSNDQEYLQTQYKNLLGRSLIESVVEDLDLKKNERYAQSQDIVKAVQSDIHIVPVITGAGGPNTRRILFGAALIGASFLFPGAGMFGTTSIFGSSVTTTFAAQIGTAISAIGAGMVLNGVSEMLFPLPKPQTFSSEEDPQLSFSFSGVQNTSRAGTPIPIVYGEIFTGSVVISAAIDTNQVEV